MTQQSKLLLTEYTQCNGDADLREKITHVRVALATVCDCICTIVSGIVIQIVLDVYYVQLYTFSSSGVMTMYKTAWVGRSLDRPFYIYLVVDKMQDVTHTYLFNIT